MKLDVRRRNHAQVRTTSNISKVVSSSSPPQRPTAKTEGAPVGVSVVGTELAEGEPVGASVVKIGMPVGPGKGTGGVVASVLESGDTVSAMGLFVRSTTTGASVDTISGVVGAGFVPDTMGAIVGVIVKGVWTGLAVVVDPITTSRNAEESDDLSLLFCEATAVPIATATEANMIKTTRMRKCFNDIPNILVS